MKIYDVVIIGGGPAGLSAALNLGRARRRVLLCDSGPRRNAAAERVHGFVTRDGIAPEEFRHIARQQLEPYANVRVRDDRVTGIGGTRGQFDVQTTAGSIEARRVLLCTGMLDVLPDIEGFKALWGHSIFQCPYCHGWEVQNRSFGYLAPSVEMLDFALFLRAWTSDVVALTNGTFAVPPDAHQRLSRADVRIEERRIARLTESKGHLKAVGFTEGNAIPLDVLFTRLPQRQVDLVQSLGLTLDSAGYIQVDQRRETSIPGIYAGGDVASNMQSAVLAAAFGVQAASMLNHELTTELAINGALL